MPVDLVDVFRNRYKDFTPDRALSALRDSINIPPEPQEVVSGWPPVNTPASFRPYPEVIGGPELHNAVKDAFRIAPELQGRAKRIGYPPTDSVFRFMEASGIPADQYEHTTNMGLTHNRNDVFINPNPEYQDELPSTVIHELAHTAGRNEIGAQEAEALYGLARPQAAKEDPIDHIIQGLAKAGIKFKTGGQVYNPNGR